MRGSWSGWLAALVFAATGAFAGATSTYATEVQRADEYRVKAAFLLNFVKFVEWPAETFSTPTAPLHVCVLGADPFGEVLDAVVQGRIGTHPIATRRIADLEEGCHLLFIAGSERKRLSALTDRLRAGGVLTVSDDDGSSARGGMIELFTDGDSVRFNIYPEAIERSGLHASARLIALAANQRHAAGGQR